MAPKIPNSAKITDTNESSELCEQPEIMKQILDRLTNIENKIDVSNKLVKSLENKVRITEDKLSKVEADFAVLSENYKEIVERLNLIERGNKNRDLDDKSAKIAINKIQQRGRICTIRVLNMKEEVKSSREAASLLYEQLFRVTLTDDNGQHPGAYRVIEYAHLLPPPPGKASKYDGFNYICRFHGRYFKEPIITNKKEILAAYNSANNVKVKISQDFTYTNRQALGFLHKQDCVSIITVRGDRLLVKLTADGGDGVWREILDPFSRSVPEMIGDVE